MRKVDRDKHRASANLVAWVLPGIFSLVGVNAFAHPAVSTPSTAPPSPPLWTIAPSVNSGPVIRVLPNPGGVIHIVPAPRPVTVATPSPNPVNVTVPTLPTLITRITTSSSAGGGGFSGSAADGTPTDKPGELQRSLGATGEEWKVIGPLIDRVTDGQQLLNLTASGIDTASRTSTGGGNDAFGGPGDRTTGGTSRPTPNAREIDVVVDILPDQPAQPQIMTVKQALIDLTRAVADKQTPSSKLESLTAPYRLAVQRARHNLEDVQRELRSIVTAKQEAKLMLLGIL